MEHTASWYVRALAQTLFTHAAGAVDVGIRRDGPSAKPRIHAARSDYSSRTADGAFTMRRLLGWTGKMGSREKTYAKLEFLGATHWTWGRFSERSQS
jgi:hypothetical protein